MTYHTNHCWCNSSHWDNQSWDGEVMVYFEDTIDTDSLGYNQQLKDPDFERLTIKQHFFDENKYEENITFRKELFESLGKEFSEKNIEIEKKLATKIIRTLKPEVLEWLEKNIEDKLFVDEKVSEGNKKGWCIGSSSYISRNEHLTIFFARQIDALRFINEFSIFKKPTFYFDYFRDDRREMSPKDILQVHNEYFNLNLKLEDLKLEEHDHETSLDLDYSTFQLLDWEKEMDEDGYCDDCDLTKEEVILKLQKYDLI